MRLAELGRDSWELRSGEESARQHPDSFHIPPLDLRSHLEVGQAAKLIFDIESEDSSGTPIIQGERMWVIVAERVGEFYVGILDSQPTSIEPSEKVYLRFGAEIPFSAEHVVEVVNPPSEYVDWQLGQEPAKRWPRQ